jgi:hypothetical protein
MFPHYCNWRWIDRDGDSKQGELSCQFIRSYRETISNLTGAGLLRFSLSLLPA